MKPPLLVIAGSTASGKTAVAIELSKKIPCEIISCDSMQVYKSMPILTGQGNVKTPKIHLNSFLSPSEEYSAAQFRKDAEKKIQAILKKKKTPVMTAGTGLYLRALLDGLFELPKDLGSGDDALRQELYQEAERKGSIALHAKLKEIDPVYAQKIHPNDLRRVVRALEVFKRTGKPFSEHHATRQGIRQNFKVRVFLIDRDREDLYKRIDTRVDQMMDDGLLSEVKKLSKKKLSQTASMALGIRQMQAFLEKKSTLIDAVTLLKRDTRHYAKRQLSWFRHEKKVEPVPVKPKDSAAVIAQKILKTWKRKA